MNKNIYKESKEQRLERIRMIKTISEKVIPDKKVYNRKKQKVKKVR